MITETKVDNHLLHADLLRIISKGFSYPSEENLLEIKEIATEIADSIKQNELKELLLQLVSQLKEVEIQPEYSRLFLMKQVPLNESNCCARLNAVTDVAGFYHAFGMKPKSGDAPDAINYELEFLALLLVKFFIAATPEQKEITSSAFTKFVNDHLYDFIKKFNDKMLGAECAEYYKTLLALLNKVIPVIKLNY